MEEATDEALQGQYVISVWRSQGIYAIVHDPQLSIDRQICIRDLADQLSNNLKVFLVPQSTQSQDAFLRALKDKVIEPAVSFHEELICERNIYRLTFDKYLPHLDDPDGATANKNFYHDLPKLECLVVKAKKQISLDGVINRGLETEELRNRLSKLCTLRPALTKCQISDKDGIGEPEILTKQKMLVLWDPDFSGTEDRTFFYELGHPTDLQISGMI